MHERTFKKSHFNMSNFLAWFLPKKGVKHGPALSLACLIADMQQHNGHCTLSNASLMKRMSASRHELRTAKSKLVEADIIHIERRADSTGDLTNEMYLRPVTKCMIQTYVDERAIDNFGNRNTVVIRKNGKPLRGLHERFFHDDVPDRICSTIEQNYEREPLPEPGIPHRVKTSYLPGDHPEVTVFNASYERRGHDVSPQGGWREDAPKYKEYNSVDSTDSETRSVRLSPHSSRSDSFAKKKKQKKRHRPASGPRRHFVDSRNAASPQGIKALGNGLPPISDYGSKTIWFDKNSDTNEARENTTCVNPTPHSPPPRGLSWRQASSETHFFTKLPVNQRAEAYREFAQGSSHAWTDYRELFELQADLLELHDVPGSVKALPKNTDNLQCMLDGLRLIEEKTGQSGLEFLNWLLRNGGPEFVEDISQGLWQGCDVYTLRCHLVVSHFILAMTKKKTATTGVDTHFQRVNAAEHPGTPDDIFSGLVENQRSAEF